MTYCISDLHGCYDEFMALLEQINFNPSNDTLYILGDAIDRGDKPIDCLNYIMKTPNVHFIIGNHEQMMMDYYNGKDIWGDWGYNGNEITKKQIHDLTDVESEKIFSYLIKRPYYKTIDVNGQRYFLSHAGLDVSVPFKYQTPKALVWSREEFYEQKALKDYICIFGHTPTLFLRNSYDCSVWFDTEYKDKICIDCGCVYGGALAALRLDDGKVFYIKSNIGRHANMFTLNLDDSVNFLQTAKQSIST